MLGWKILKHSAVQVYLNLGAALRISAILFAIQVSISLYFVEMVDGSWMYDSGIRRAYMLNMFVSTVTSLWIAVAWHRYILTGEMAGGWLPKLRVSQMLNYLVRTIFIFGIAVLPLSFAFGIIIGVLWVISLHTLDPVAMIVKSSMVLSIPLFFILFRLSPILPAAALGKKLTLKETWKSTKGSTGTIALILLIIVIFYGIIAHFLQPYIAEFSAFSVFWVVIAGWAQKIFSLSVITTIYGYYVEGRALI